MIIDKPNLSWRHLFQKPSDKMASLGNALVSKILGHSAAEKAFRPWWDNMEDFLVYGLVMLGKEGHDW